MRLAVPAVVLVGLAAPAVACPPRDACMVTLRSTIPAAPSATTSAVASVTSVLELPLLAPTKRPPGEVEVPWIWSVLRDEVYARMPTYRNRDELKVVLAPVVVTSPSDTVPGLGIAGAF